MAARRAIFADIERTIGPEIDAPDLLAVPLKASAIVVTNKHAIGRTLAAFAADPQLRGVYLDSLQRGTVRLPREPGVQVQRGDILHVVGAPDDVERAGACIGFIERDLSRTDLAFLAGGICCGILLALAQVTVGGVTIGLGAAGSILIVGVLAGWFRSRYPVFGSIPEPAQRLLMDLGLTVFVALIGLKAGPHAVEAYHARGGTFFLQIFLSGVVVTTIPLLVGAFVGRFVLRMDPLMLSWEDWPGRRRVRPVSRRYARRAKATSSHWVTPYPTRSAASCSPSAAPSSWRSCTRVQVMSSSLSPTFTCPGGPCPSHRLVFHTCGPGTIDGTFMSISVISCCGNGTLAEHGRCWRSLHSARAPLAVLTAGAPGCCTCSTMLSSLAVIFAEDLSVSNRFMNWGTSRFTVVPSGFFTVTSRDARSIASTTR